MLYTARYEFEGLPALTKERAIRILDELDGLHASVGSPDGERLAVTITFDAATFEDAAKTGIERVVPAVNARRSGVGSGAMPTAGEVMTTDEWDRRQGFVPLMSVSQVAEAFDMTRQAVLKMIERHWFQSARRIGETWAISRDEVMLKKPRSGAEYSEALSRDAMARAVTRHEADRTQPLRFLSSDIIASAEDVDD